MALAQDGAEPAEETERRQISEVSPECCGAILVATPGYVEVQMPKNSHIQVDCIADVHFSPHIIPPLLVRLRRSSYDLFLTECGAGLEQAENCPSPDDSALDELVHKQKDYAKKSNTLNMGRGVAEIIGCEPMTIDHPGYYLFAMRELKKISERFRQTEGSNENNTPAAQLWSDAKYRAEVIGLLGHMMVKRDGWMVRQIKAISATVSGQRKRPVRALVLVGLGHATVLERALRPWCRFRHLVSLRAAKVAVSEYLQVLGGRSDGLEKIQTLPELRHEMLRAELTGWGVPEGELSDIMGQVAPNSLDTKRIERWFHPAGRVAAEIPFRHDQHDGLAKYYTDSGELLATAQYKNGKLGGPCRHYGKGAIVRSEHVYRDGRLDGESRWYSETGSLQTVAFYKAGLQDGIGKAYHESGRLKAEFRYKYGKTHGVTRYYDESGQVTSETLYRNGVEVKKCKSKPAQSLNDEAGLCRNIRLADE